MLYKATFLLLGLFDRLHATTHRPPVESFEPDYGDVIRLSLLFYESQRSGHLPATNRVRWRADSALNDRGNDGEDLTGGYYDASDYVKFGFTMAFATSLFGWGLLLYADTYKEIGEYENALEAVKWATDYFVKCHVKRDEFYGQVGDFFIDHQYWGRPEDLNTTRPAYKIDGEHPGTDLAAETSAALSIASLIFADVNRTYSQLLLRHAVELYELSVKYEGFYYKNMPGYKNYYENLEYEDELAWALLWLYKATGDGAYLAEARVYYDRYNLSRTADYFWFETKSPGVQLLMALETGEERYKTDVETFCNRSIYEQKRTPLGLVFINAYGTLAYAADIAFVCLKASDFSRTPRVNYRFARSQIDYMLGSTGRSYVVGYGRDYPTRPHHAASSCPDPPAPCGWEYYKTDAANPHVLYGALVSGPLSSDLYRDQRFEFLYNQVTIDYNAGFQGVLAGLLHYRELDAEV